MNALDDVLARLDGVRRTSRGFIARCPGHRDRRPSLSIAEGAGGRPLLHCFAGCRFDEIVSALGLERTEHQARTTQTTLDLAIRIARGQSWNREDVRLAYEIARAIRRRRRAVDVAREAATRAGDCEVAWNLLERAARVDVEADAIEAELEETMR